MAALYGVMQLKLTLNTANPNVYHRLGQISMAVLIARLVSVFGAEINSKKG